MKDLGPLHYFAGIQVHRTTTDIHLSQSTYALDLLDQALISSCNPISTSKATEYSKAVNGDVFVFQSHSVSKHY